MDVFGFLGLVALWPVLGRWSFPLASLLSSLMVIGVGCYYTTRSYRLMGLDPVRELDWRRKPRLVEGSIKEVLGAGLASGVMSLDALVALVALTAAARRSPSGTLFILL